MLVLHLEAFALPLQSERATQKPYAVCMVMAHGYTAAWLYIPQASTVTLFLTVILKVAKFQDVGNKALINAFEYVLYPTHPKRASAWFEYKCKFIVLFPKYANISTKKSRFNTLILKFSNAHPSPEPMLARWARRAAEHASLASEG